MLLREWSGKDMVSIMALQTFTVKKGVDFRVGNSINWLYLANEELVRFYRADGRGNWYEFKGKFIGQKVCWDPTNPSKFGVQKVPKNPMRKLLWEYGYTEAVRLKENEYAPGGFYDSFPFNNDPAYHWQSIVYDDNWNPILCLQWCATGGNIINHRNWWYDPKKCKIEDVEKALKQLGRL
jgi:hypothetical protein